MKLKHIEVAPASLLLLESLYNLLGTAHSYPQAMTGNGSSVPDQFAAHWLHFDFAVNYVIPELITYFTLYTSFLWVACGWPNSCMLRRQWAKALWGVAGGFLVTWLLLTINNCLSHPYGNHYLWNAGYRQFDRTLTFYLVLLTYQAAKQSVGWLLLRNKSWGSAKQRALFSELIYFVIGWLVVLGGCLLLRVHWGWTLFYTTIIPCAFITYLIIQYWLIPVYWEQRRGKGLFWLMLLLITFGINLPFTGLYAGRATYTLWVFLLVFTIAWLSQLCMLVPLAFYVHRYRRELEAELTGLRTDLQHAAADALFLRSQINPHFLFNALNTLYGLALTEQAEATAEGIQKLGSMMRFMLHENHQDRIALSREIDYLNDYISLQNMRMAATPAIQVTTFLPRPEGEYTIAPMLLIPFVENAYKHGISQQQHSWINISLQVNANVLQFDINNSVHPADCRNPEKQHPGIGLDNVKQRLQLLYPQRHELVIRPTPSEFFIHLTLQLS